MRHYRRTCARLCRVAGGELEQIQFLLRHVSVQTAERYLGCTQRLASAVNDKIGIEAAPSDGPTSGRVADDPLRNSPSAVHNPCIFAMWTSCFQP
jgi:hypothetical protein